MKTFPFLSARLDLLGLCLIAALAAACSFDASQLRPLPDAASDLPPATADGSAGIGGQTDAVRSDTTSSLDARGIPIFDAQSDGSPADTSYVGPTRDAASDGPFSPSCSTGYHDGGDGK